MRIGIYSRLLKEVDTPLVQNILQVLEELAIEVHVYEPYYRQLKKKMSWTKEPITFTSHDNLVNKIDYLFSIGGDGSMLTTLILVRNTNIPVLGINTGRLGLLTGVGRRDEMKNAIQLLADKKYTLDKRTLLHLDSNQMLFNGINYGLNEFTIQKRDTASMITIHTFIDDKFINSYWADGIIVATPTGSTAYSLSCGGPIIYPNAGAFVITPIAPHNLNIRPIIVPDDSTISFEVESRNNLFLCSLDSRNEIVDTSYHLSVRKSPFVINLIRFEHHNFFTTIRDKLGWGMDSRH